MMNSYEESLYVEEMNEAKRMIKKYEFLLERLECISASINRLEKMSSEAFKEMEQLKEDEKQLDRTCKQKYGEDFDIYSKILLHTQKD